MAAVETQWELTLVFEKHPISIKWYRSTRDEVRKIAANIQPTMHGDFYFVI